MKAIQKRLFSIIVLSSILMLFLMIVFIITALMFKGVDYFYTLLMLLVSILPLSLFFREYNKYSFAKLIIDNKILCIPAVEIAQESQKIGLNSIPIEGIDIYISCFGILLGSKVIKFNIDGVALKKVEVGSDFICLTYGNDKITRIIKLIHGVISTEELQSIAERFRYETGIIPIVLN